MKSIVFATVIAGIMAVMVTGIVVPMLEVHTANAVCSADGRCTGPGGSNGTAGTVGPCVNGYRNLTSSDGRVLVQRC